MAEQNFPYCSSQNASVAISHNLYLLSYVLFCFLIPFQIRKPVVCCFLIFPFLGFPPSQMTSLFTYWFFNTSTVFHKLLLKILESEGEEKGGYVLLWDLVVSNTCCNSSLSPGGTATSCALMEQGRNAYEESAQRVVTKTESVTGENMEGSRWKDWNGGKGDIKSYIKDRATAWDRS